MTKPFKELQGMNKDDLAGRLYEVKKENIKLQAQVAIGAVPKNSLQIRNHKRTIARILTLLNQQKMSVSSSPRTTGHAPEHTPVGKKQQTPQEQKGGQKAKQKLTHTKSPIKQKGQ